jgi:WD40 repeat protein
VTFVTCTCQLCRSGDGSLLVTAEAGPPPSIRLWDFATASSLAVISVPTLDVGTLCFSGDSTLLAVYGRDTHARVWRRCDASSLCRACACLGVVSSTCRASAQQRACIVPHLAAYRCVHVGCALRRLS